MTDVLIKNWCIPECCMDCDPDFAYAINCKAYNENNDFTRQRAENCPLVEIKHSQDGDTISRADAVDVVTKHKISFTVQQDVAREIDALPSAEAVKVAYICDGRKCDSDCSECFRTLDIEHARDFKLMGDTYFQQEAEAKPIVIRCKTLLGEDDFKRIAERIKEENQNVIVIPCDAEVVSAEAVQGAGRYENAMQKLREMPKYLNGVKARQIKKIPPEAVQGWIPCSERLPEIACRCLVTLSNNVVAVGTLHGDGEYEDDFGRIVSWGKRWHLEPTSMMIAYPEDSVIAWQPLPKPYKGGDDK